MWMDSPARYPDSATLEEIPGGAAGTRATLGNMVTLIRQAKLPPILPTIRALAVMIVAAAAPPHKAYAAQAEAVQQWVQRNIRFVRDVRGMEMLTPPAYLIATRAGDCDDQSMLVAALLESIGLPTRLVAGGPDAETFVHVWAEVQIGGQWCACETTEPYAFGRRPQFRCYVVHPV